MNPVPLIMTIGLISLGFLLISVSLTVMAEAKFDREKLEYFIALKGGPGMTVEIVITSMHIALCLGIFFLMCAGYMVWGSK